jgi:hypothetical protein
MAMSKSIIYSTIPLYDVFVYGKPGEPLICYLCNFGDMMDVTFLAESIEEMIGHLRAHLNKGDILPTNIFEQINVNAEVHYRPQK